MPTNITDVESAVECSGEESEKEINIKVPFDEWARETKLVDGVVEHSGFLSTSWSIDSKYGEIVNRGMMEAEYTYAKDLLSQTSCLTGAICEFGVYKGHWLKVLSDACLELGVERPIYGFDSFEGLPEPMKGRDLPFLKGEFSDTIYEEVYNTLDCKTRDITLIKGWFEDTLKSSQALAVKEIAYARIDCDLYLPALQCLEFLQPRLVDGAILVFDDWCWGAPLGETRAFYEWALASGFKFQFLAYNSWMHLYMRVLR